MSRRVILLLALLLTACEYRLKPTRFISTTDEQLYAMCLEASGRWYDATGINVECLYGLGDKYLPLEWGYPGRVCAAGSTSRARIRIRREPLAECNEREMTPEAHLAIVTHEMGHAIVGGGLGHAESGVMARSTGPGAIIDQASIDWLCVSAECVWTDPE